MASRKHNTLYLDNIEEYLAGNQLVTYRWLSEKLGVSSDVSKKMLYAYAEAKADQGVSKTSHIHQMKLIPQHKLEETKQTMDPITSLHVYSLQNQYPKDARHLWTQEYTLYDEKLQQGTSPHDIWNNKWSSIHFDGLVEYKPGRLAALSSAHKENDKNLINLKSPSSSSYSSSSSSSESSTPLSSSSSSATQPEKKEVKKATPAKKGTMGSFFKPVNKDEEIKKLQEKEEEHQKKLKNNEEVALKETAKKSKEDSDKKQNGKKVSPKQTKLTPKSVVDEEMEDVTPVSQETKNNKRKRAGDEGDEEEEADISGATPTRRLKKKAVVKDKEEEENELDALLDDDFEDQRTPPYKAVGRRKTMTDNEDSSSSSSSSESSDSESEDGFEQDNSEPQEKDDEVVEEKKQKKKKKAKEPKEKKPRQKKTTPKIKEPVQTTTLESFNISPIKSKSPEPPSNSSNVRMKQVVVTKTTVNEKGYKVTKDVIEWVPLTEEELAEEQKKNAPIFQPLIKLDVKKDQPLQKSDLLPKEIKQANIKSFFTKKS